MIKKFKRIIKYYYTNNIFSYININYKKRKTLHLLRSINVIHHNENTPKYIISLTSFKERLSTTAPYAIITMFNQSIKPDKIILWVAYEDKKNVPDILYKLVEKGLEIRFCEDLKSHKKLIPSLIEFPDDNIIIADDDVYYPYNWFEQLVLIHKNNPKNIICHRVHGIKVDDNHNPLPYKNWDKGIDPNVYFINNSRHMVFPTGVGGVLYPPHCLFNDITNKELINKLSPNSDDVWFWSMAVINKEYFGEDSPYIIIPHGFAKVMPHLIEPNEKRKGFVLNQLNETKYGKDYFIKSIINHYPQIKEVFNKIQPTTIK